MMAELDDNEPLPTPGSTAAQRAGKDPDRSPEWGAASHTGLSRTANEDDYIVVDPSDAAIRGTHGRLFAVADGMGGVPGGGEASRTALRAMARGWLADRPGVAPGLDPSLDPSLDLDPVLRSAVQGLEGRLRAGVTEACQAVYETGRQMPALAEMGCTLTAALLWRDRLVVAHIGDTRCFLVRDGKLTWQTVDHAAERPQTYLTRCVGGGRPMEEPDLVQFAVRPGDVVGIASDGIWSVVSERSLLRCLDEDSLQSAAETMVERANAGGGPDNSTVVLCRLLEVGARAKSNLSRGRRENPFPRPYHAPKLRMHPPLWPIILAVAAAALLALGIAKLMFGQDWLG